MSLSGPGVVNDLRSAAAPEAPHADDPPFTVRVSAPARLQMALLDLRGEAGRLFGGVGAALDEPRTVVVAGPATGLSLAGPDAGRAAETARRALARWNLAGAAVRVVRAIPAHAGLGSGTQLALAVAAAIAEAHALPRDLRTLVGVAGRGGRSGVGSWTFEQGGLVVDGGHAVAARRAAALAVAGAAGDLPPLLVRQRLPASWRCVVVVPRSGDGLAGGEERDAFARLPPPPAALVHEMAHAVLLGVLPAVVEGDLDAFGGAVTRLQELMGDCFAPVQGDRFASVETAHLVGRMRDAGAAGAGQSSWGPAVYGFVEGDAAAARLASLAAEWSPGAWVVPTAFDDCGARVSRLAMVPRPSAF